MSAAPKAAPANPFPGLRPYREEEQHLFFGRERHVDRMVDKIGAHRFLAVVGSSGSGKSSLVNCGFKPALRRGLLAEAGTSWRMVQIRPGGNPIRALATELAQPSALFENVSKDLPLADMLDATLRLSSRGLVDIYRQARLPERTNLLVVVDQFEELFRYRNPAADNAFGPAQDTTAFIRLLLESAAQPDYRIYIALTMRSDFLGDCVQFDGLPEAINEGQYLVPRLTRDERRSVVEGPISSAGAVISPVLLTQLVNDVGDNPDQLSILQHALNRTWAQWKHDCQSQGPVSLENYEAIGTMAHALDQHANKAWKELATPRHQLLCERAFKALTDRGTDQRGIRRPLRFASLCAIVDADPSESVEVLKPFRKLSRSFVMPDEHGAIGPDTWIDISHESFMRLWTKLRDWAGEEAESAREYRRLSDRAIGHYRSPEKFGLMQDPDLQSSLDFEKLRQPTAAWADLYGGGFEEATRFLRESETKREEERVERELERLWQLRWQPAISAVVALVFFGVLIMNRAALSLADLRDRTWLDSAWSFFKISLMATPFALFWVAISWYGKKVHHRFARRLVLRATREQAKATIKAPQTTAHDLAAILSANYAPWRRRTIGATIDFIIEYVILILVGILIASITRFTNLFAGPDSVDFLVGLLGTATMLGYHLFTTGSSRQATFGMRAVRIHVTMLDGSRVSRRRATARQLVKMAVSPLLMYWPLIYLIARRWNPQFVQRRQWLGDLASKTVVVYKPNTAPPPHPKPAT
jgi:uncharacterized RDD family membrane protein YckC